MFAFFGDGSSATGELKLSISRVALALFSFFLFFDTGLPGQALADENAKPKIIKDVVYRNVGDKELRLDLAIPDGKGPFPTVICIHGGAWRFGDRDELSKVIERLAERGYVAATIDYRKLPDYKFPDAIVDCKTAVRFLRANAEKYRIDKKHIGALGYSAGAYLACMLGVAGTDAGFEGTEYPDESSKVQAVVSYFAPTDLALYGNDNSAENSTFVPLLGARYKDNPKIYAKASPITYVTKKAPPFLLLHGTKDWIVPIEHSRVMRSKLKGAGVPAELIEVEGEAHGWGAEKSRVTWASTFKFLAEHLKK